MSSKCRFTERNASVPQSFHQQTFLNMSESHSHRSPGPCWKTEEPASRLQAFLQSTLRVSSSPVTESDTQSQAPPLSRETFVLCKVSFCIALVWDRPFKNLRTHSHSFQKLPMGCISDKHRWISINYVWTNSEHRVCFIFLSMCHKPNCAQN